MNKELFFKSQGTTYKRITKPHARKLFNQGKLLCIAPVNANMYYNLCNLYIFINKYDYDNNEILDFDKAINVFEYYNCNSELGHYTKFFVNEKEL